MQSSKIIWLFAILGGFIGGYIPALWGAPAFSMSGVLFSTIGGIAGIYVGFKLTH